MTTGIAYRSTTTTHYEYAVRCIETRGNAGPPPFACVTLAACRCSVAQCSMLSAQCSVLSAQRSRVPRRQSLPAPQAPRTQDLPTPVERCMHPAVLTAVLMSSHHRPRAEPSGFMHAQHTLAPPVIRLPVMASVDMRNADDLSLARTFPARRRSGSLQGCLRDRKGGWLGENWLFLASSIEQVAGRR